MAKFYIMQSLCTLFVLWIVLKTSFAKIDGDSILPQSDQAAPENTKDTGQDWRILDSNDNHRETKGEKPKKSASVSADAYLEKFGYLSTPTVGESHDAASRRKAIREFQRMAGIEQTGLLDDPTRYWMQQPRCGLPDRVPHDANISEWSGRASAGPEPEGYHVPGYKWSRNYLTWRISRYSSDLSRDSQRRAMYNAFTYWSDVTPLTFNELSSSDPDIDIMFGYYEHGDGYSFDGQGGTLAHAFFPENGDTHFDESEEWTERTDRGTNLEIVAAHEFGHALGLGHSDVEGALMRPFYQGYDPNFKLGYDDILGIQSLYGPKERPDPTPRPTERPDATATPTQAPEIPDSCTTRFDAVFQGSDGVIYVFKQKWLWKLHYWGAYPGYPVPARDVFTNPPTNIRAAVYSFRSGYTYLFKGLNVFTYSGMEKVNRRRISARGYEPPQSAFMASDGRIYLLRGRYYWIFDENTQTVETGIKRRITDKWPGLPENIEAAVRLNDGFIYAFKGARYRKFDERSNTVVEGYPKPKAGPWMGPSCTEDGNYQEK